MKGGLHNMHVYYTHNPQILLLLLCRIKLNRITAVIHSQSHFWLSELKPYIPIVGIPLFISNTVIFGMLHLINSKLPWNPQGISGQNTKDSVQKSENHLPKIKARIPLKPKLPESSFNISSKKHSPTLSASSCMPQATVY